MLLAILYWLVTGLVGVVTALVIYARWKYGTLEKVQGLPAIVKPAFVGGSDPFFYKKIVHEEDMKNVKKYGPIYGFYEGREPHIYITDPEILRLIFIKDFDHFQNKRILDFGHELINEMMDILPYDKWKVVRNHISPQLTTGKIRAMSHQMLETINDWVSKINDKAQGEDTIRICPKETYTGLTTDVIARCAFGTKINALDDPENLFVKYSKQMSGETIEYGPMISIAWTLPFLMKLSPFFPPEVMDYFGGVLRSILEARRKSSQQRVNDFVDIMNGMIEKCETLEYKKLAITETTVMCQAMIFLLAGFETTAATLSLLSYHLAKEPKIQDKLIEEVDAYLERHDGKIEHESIGELTYLHACMNETLRMHPPLIRLERVCTKDWFHEETKLLVKKGMVIQAPAYPIHYNEKYFPEPEEFKPDRFLPENKEQMNQYAFLSFGQGPHNCIGMRFAKEEVQMTMASVLKNFRIEDPEGAKLIPLPGRAFLTPFEPFYLNLCKRNLA